MSQYIAYLQELSSCLVVSRKRRLHLISTPSMYMRLSLVQSRGLYRSATDVLCRRLCCRHGRAKWKMWTQLRRNLSRDQRYDFTCCSLGMRLLLFPNFPYVIFVAKLNVQHIGSFVEFYRSIRSCPFSSVRAAKDDIMSKYFAILHNVTWLPCRVRVRVGQ